AACLGNLTTPVGAKVLCEMATQPTSSDTKSDVLLRRQAVWALASLGNNCQRFEGLPRERKEQILAALDRFAALAGDKGGWAFAASDYLRHHNSQGVIAALARCAAAEDPFLRRQAALALSFWQGTAEENRAADETLLKLTRDYGR